MLLATLALWALHGEPVRAASGSSYNFVNFGFTEDSNTWYHEQDILSFTNGLFDPQNTHILSAAGPGTKFADNDGNGNFLRRPDGSLELKNSSLAAKTEKASLANWRAMYERIANGPEDSALVVLGDHGSQYGLTPWTEDYASGGEFISPEVHYETLAQVPTTKTLRHIYLQCFAGTTLVDVKRTIPTSPSELNGFLDKYYPPNRCGLALSRHDEMGQYNQNGKDWRHSAWTDYFKTVKPISLSTMKRHLNGDSDLSPTTVVTSDYMAEDILKFACQEKVRDELINCEPNNSNSRLRAAANETFAHVCSMEDIEKDLAMKRKATSDAFNIWPMPGMYKNYWLDEYLKITDPAMAAKIQKYQVMNYNLYTAQAGNVSETEKQKLLAEAEAISQEIGPAFGTELMRRQIEVSQGKDPKFAEYFKKNCTLEFMKSDLAKKLLPPEFKLPPPTQNTCDEERTHLFSEFRKIQKVSKDAELQAQKMRDQLVATLLEKNPSLKPLKERYENIRKCENGSLK